MISIKIRPVTRAVLACSVVAMCALTTDPARAEEKSALSLPQVINRALENSPVLAASSSRADAATAGRSLAGALPNPELSIEADNIYGDGPYKGTDGAELTYGVSQLVELPGKRSSRVRVAEAENQKSHYDRDAARLDLIRDVTIAYAVMAAAQQEVSILEEEQRLATEVYEGVSAKVEAGKEPPIQKNKAAIERSTSAIALERSQRNLESAQQSLSALMGDGVEEVSVPLAEERALMEPEPIEFYRERLIQTPDIKGLDSDVMHAQSNLSLEKANAFPDPTINLGIKDSREDDRQAFIAGVSFPIPVFNLNRSGIERAGHELNAVMMDQRSAQLSLRANLSQVYGEYTSAYRDAVVLTEIVLPGAEEAFSFARQGYDAGKFGYLEVLDAQRTLFDARKQWAAVTLDYHRQRAVIERMTAIHAADYNTKE